MSIISSLDHVRDGHLFTATTSGGIKGPNHGSFDPKSWTKALDGRKVTPRDGELLVAATYFGLEFGRIRRTIRSVFSKLTPLDAVDLVVAILNASVMQVLDQMRQQAEERSADEPAMLGDDGSVRIQNVAGQELLPDDAIAIITDAIANLLFHAGDSRMEAGSGDREAALVASRALLQFGSLETAFQECWNKVLWEGATIGNEENGFGLRPGDRDLAELWLVWQRRFETQVMQHGAFLYGSRMVDDDKTVVPSPLDRSVTQLERNADGKLRFIVGSAGEDAGRILEHLALQNTYLGMFLDIPLPKPEGTTITYRDLWTAWWVIRDVATLLREECDWNSSDWTLVENGCLRVPMDALASAISDVLGRSADEAREILDLFTTDPIPRTGGEKGDLFRNATWGRPIIRAPGEETGRIVLASLHPTPVLLMERWMSRTGFTSPGEGTKPTKDRGFVFEDATRKRLEARGLANPLIDEFAIGSFPGTNGDEEIDVLIRIGSVIVVGEVKCFNIPFESIDRHNHLLKVCGASEQANRKAQWCRNNIGKVLDTLDVPANERERDWRCVPLVILNSPYGAGLVLNGCPITDLEWLAHVLGENEVVSGGVFVRGHSATFTRNKVYGNGIDLQDQFETIVTTPPSIAIERGRVAWQWTSIPSTMGDGFAIEHPVSSGLPDFGGDSVTHTPSPA